MKSKRRSVVLDDIDMMILRRLAVYGKEGIRELARNLGKSPSTIAFRIKRLEREGVIRGYTTVIDYRKLGYQINAITLLQVDGAYIEELEEILTKEPNVKAVYDVTGEYDIAIITSFREIEDLDRFIKRIIKIPHVKRSMTSIIFRVVKETPHVEEFLR
ncbi:MAG: Lrp/AsnC family transcriptional regulator [Desulfurococcales archaeon]|nr:Lrp/AsnC family transcriptional regulator [Desulfurococcales archaeon]